MTTDIPQQRTDDGAFILGDEDAPVTIVAFEDFLCPHCQDYQATLQRFIEECVADGLARFEYRDWAIHGDDSIFAYGLVICAAEDEVPFLDAHDLMFDMAGDESFSDEQARAYAERLDRNDIPLTTCAAENEQFRADAHLATSLGINATPTITVRDADGNIDLDALPRQPDFETLRDYVQQHQ